MSINQTADAPTYRYDLFLSGPIEVAKQAIRGRVVDGGLCVTIEPTTYIFAGGEEQGYRVGLLNYPRFPVEKDALRRQAVDLALALLEATHQHSVLVVGPDTSEWYSRRAK